MALHFTPRAIQAYSAALVAEVEGGSDPRTRAFSCELRGEGSLPSLTLQVGGSTRVMLGPACAEWSLLAVWSSYQPARAWSRRHASCMSCHHQEPPTMDASGRPNIKFGKLLVGRSARHTVLVRNNGVLPATARLEVERHDAFSVLEGPQVRGGVRTQPAWRWRAGSVTCVPVASWAVSGCASSAALRPCAHEVLPWPRLLLQPITVEPKKTATFTVAFAPRAAGTHAHELALRVKSNPFEQLRIAMSGEGVQVGAAPCCLERRMLGALRASGCHRQLTGLQVDGMAHARAHRRTCSLRVCLATRWTSCSSGTCAWAGRQWRLSPSPTAVTASTSGEQARRSVKSSLTCD